MRFLSITIISLFGLSLALATSDVPVKSLKTAFANLRDGFDAVYKVNKHLSFSDQELKKVEREFFDLYLRKSSQNDPNKVVMHLKNIENVKTIGDKERDHAALTLPMVLQFNFFQLFGDLESVYLTEADTNPSMISKVISWKDLDMAFTEIDTAIKMMKNSDFTGDYLFGNCNVSMGETKSNGKVTIEVNTTRKQCTGEFMYKGLFKKYNTDAEDVDGASSMHIKFQYDETSHQIMEFSLAVKAPLASERKMTFMTGMEVRFDGFKEIQEVFDETKMTKKFSKEDFYSVQSSEVKKAKLSKA